LKKWRVRSGDVCKIVEAPNKVEAFIAAFDDLPQGTMLGLVTEVAEVEPDGSVTEDPERRYYTITHLLLRDLGYEVREAKE